jgi:hypothetical protein
VARLPPGGTCDMTLILRLPWRPGADATPHGSIRSLTRSWYEA